MTRRFVGRSALALSLLSPFAPGQRPAAWASVKIDGGVQASRLKQLGKLVIHHGQSRVLVFSAFTRSWTALSVSAQATLRHANDWVLVRDGNRWSAASAITGEFRTLTVSPAATVLNPVAQRNDGILLVQDGRNLHAFSGLVGRWVSRSVSSSMRVAVLRQTAILADGLEVSGMSALHGRWVSRTVGQPATSLHADSMTGVAETKARVFGFSAQTSSWTSATPLAGARRRAAWDVVVWTAGPLSLAFSGLRGRFVLTTTAPAPSVTVDGDLAVVSTPSELHFFSGPLASWTRLSVASGTSLRTARVTALAKESKRLHAYSALSGRVTTRAVSSSREDLSQCLAAFVDAGAGAAELYSAFTDRWVALPKGAKRGLPSLATQAALVEMAGKGFAAFSARSGAFVGLDTAAGAVPSLNNQSSLVAVSEAGRLHVFEARRGTWLSTATSSAVRPVLWRTTLVAVDGVRAYGYGSQSGVIESFPLPEPVSSTKASSESGRAVTANHVLAFSSVPDLTSLWQFPEFRRLFTRGATSRFDLRASPGAASVLVFGLPRRNAVTLPGLGDLLIDLPLLVTVPFGTVGPSGRLSMELKTPDASWLSGLELFFQAVVAVPRGKTWLSRAASLMIR